jgi:ABC-type enterochelin transport system permease subunit
LKEKWINNNFMKKIFGDSWHTTLAGLLLAGLLVAQDLIDKGVTSRWTIAIAVAIAVLGRVAGDEKK